MALTLGEQAGRPLEHRAQSALARREVASTRSERVEAPVEAPRQTGRAKQLESRCGELDRQRHALEPTTELGDLRCVLGREREGRASNAGAVEEQRDRRDGGERVEVRL